MPDAKTKTGPTAPPPAAPSLPPAPYLRVGSQPLHSVERGAVLPSITAHAPIGSTGTAVVQVRDNPPGDYVDAPTPNFMLQLAEGGQGTGRSEMGAGEFTTAWRRGAMLLSAPDLTVGCSAYCAFDLSALSLSPALFREAWEGLGNGSRSVDTEALHVQAFSDRFIFELGLRFVAEAVEGNPGGTLYADSMVYLLAANLLRLAGEIDLPQEDARPLDAQALGLVTETMEDRLAERVGMGELADLLDMNVYGFSRAFRSATGMSPHQFLTDRRLARVKAMLDGTDEPLAAIAIDCGFASQSHMTATFTKYVGIPPGAWRRSRS